MPLSRAHGAYPGYCAIVDPVGESSRLLADDLHAHGLGAIALLTGAFRDFATSEPCDTAGFDLCVPCPRGGEMDAAREVCAALPVRHIQSGFEFSGPLAEAMAAALTPYGNDPATSPRRFNKHAMQETLREAGFPAIAQRRVRLGGATAESLREAAAGLRYPLFIKPDLSVGAIGSRRCETPGDLPAALADIRAHIARYDGALAISDAMALQEFMDGEERLVNSFSVDGTHYASGAFACEKLIFEGCALYRCITILDPDEAGTSMDYADRVLTALGMRNGLANTDATLLDNTLYLLEINCRMTGCSGMVAELERRVVGYDQGALLARCAAGTLGEVPARPAAHDGSGKAVFLQNLCRKTTPRIREERLRALPSYAAHTWTFDRRKPLPPPNSLLDVVGIVLLHHRDRDRLERDYAGLLRMERDGDLF